ncbi:assimilatory sulfite reductase (NADPH) flavoprotein subunit [Moritella sp. 36]|uniref:assimilatory sulfite reductase (NADPH) flavoprotein subunit n=1 Tax=Moritella sp. 36 TaxID=2746233 RepID=UPI001BA8E8EB|nr:assimilatory sulfite reductase (NADPH) flavoprotein subunit [Moritella sp. 36]QUM90786.1 assimilatory sulfite reductase (NADPH) flavoprotein subunit [Moritella sp. 36]
MLLKELSSLTSPLSELQLSQLQLALNDLSPTQTAWVSGYLAGISQASGGQLQAQGAVSQPAQCVTILFGSQTGNAKGVAEELYEQAQAQGITARLVNMADYKAKELKTESHLLIVASTNGEGEAPDDAVTFHEFLASKKAPKVPELKYSVCALGDSSYEFYCQTGLEFDERLAALGAKAVVPRADCDVDYDDAVSTWSELALIAVKATLKEAISAAPVAAVGTTHVANTYSKKKPFKTELLVNQKITGRFSGKDIRHVEIALDDSGIHYQAGDALGIWFKNDPILVDAILDQLELDGTQTVIVTNETESLRDALIHRFELTQSYPSFIQAYAEISGSKKLAKLLDDKTALRHYCYGRQILDVIDEKKAKLTAEQLISGLRKLTPRLYSIASSPNEAEGEVHLTVAVVDYQQSGEQRIGGASGFLQRLEEGAEVAVFVEHNDNFRLPSNDDTPVIMIGPGTGIAPFRAFVQERDVREAAGNNWLFFGNQHFTDDFLYQTEWQGYLKSGLLTKMDVAFSRDQAEKIYVQDRLRENAAELYAWLEQGAHIYVCGDGDRMAKDVNEALIEVVAEQGKLARSEAEEYVAELRRNKRYQRDVY